MKIKLKNSDELDLMRDGGKITAAALRAALSAVKTGITTIELDKIAEQQILDLGGQPSFKTVVGYDFSTCINVNEGLVHGLPNDYVLKKGDIVSIDLGTLYKGFHTDLSYTVEVDGLTESKFLTIGEDALNAGIKNSVAGKHIGDIGFAMQKVIESEGWSVSRDLVGHGIGKDLHEDPYVPGYGKPGVGPELKVGMVLAIEIIYQKGRPKIKVADDDWTIVTEDGSLAGLFEHTVAITKDGPEVLTSL
ncbi:MAG: type I methionyl aminopeptidase [Patescibacteria group bacterium]